MTDTILNIISYLCVAFVLLPLVKSDFWIFRSLEYSRFQNLLLCGIVVLLWLIKGLFISEIQLLPFSLNIACMFYLGVKISPYTVIRTKEVLTIKKRNPERELKLVNANVLQTNRAFSRLVQQIQNHSPHLVLLLETDHEWQKATQILKEEYPYSVEVPQDNT